MAELGVNLAFDDAGVGIEVARQEGVAFRVGDGSGSDRRSCNGFHVSVSCECARLGRPREQAIQPLWCLGRLQRFPPLEPRNSLFVAVCTTAIARLNDERKTRIAPAFSSRSRTGRCEVRLLLRCLLSTRSRATSDLGCFLVKWKRHGTSRSRRGLWSNRIRYTG